jgi:anti-sigma factor RsiW
MQHPDEGTIHAWLDGALSPEESDAIVHHVAACHACADLVAEARGVIAGASRIVSALDVVRGDVIPSAFPARPARTTSLWRRLHLSPGRAALAATVLIAVSALLVVRHDTPDKLVPTRAAARIQPKVAATPASAPAPAMASSAQPAAAPRPLEQTVRRETPAASGKAAASPRAMGGRAFAEMRTLVLDAPTTALCYQIERDSASWLRAIPLRFTLARDTATGQNVVRALSPHATLDSVIPGSNWATVSSTAISVRFAPQPREQPMQAVSLLLQTREPSALASSGTDRRQIPVRRTSCPP